MVNSNVDIMFSSILDYNLEHNINFKITIYAKRIFSEFSILFLFWDHYISYSQLISSSFLLSFTYF